MGTRYLPISEVMKGCLVPYGIYGDGIKTLEFHKGKYTIDLNPFFRDMFKRRGYYFPENPDRHETRKGDDVEITRYNFTMAEFFEAFIGRYPPDELADFLEPLLDEDTLQSEAFLGRIRRFYDEYKAALLMLSGDCRGNQSIWASAINFESDELRDILRSGLRKSDLVGGKLYYEYLDMLPEIHGSYTDEDRMKFFLKISKRKESIMRLRKALERNSVHGKPTIPIPMFPGPPLNIPEMASYYEEIDDENLELVVRVED
jgi:hypothetical protein